jgi:cytochrome c oxidase assembly protein subunit 15
VWASRSIAASRNSPARRRVVFCCLWIPPRRIASAAVAILVLLVAQVGLGGLVAGLKAGLVYDTWPLIEGRLIPPADKLFFLQPWWANLTDNHLTVQFLHRMTAYGLVALALVHAADCARSRDDRAGAVALALVLLAQASLGVATLIWHVPISLALAHQVVAMLALVVATVHAHGLMAARRGVEGGVPGERLAALPR